MAIEKNFYNNLNTVNKHNKIKSNNKACKYVDIKSGYIYINFLTGTLFLLCLDTLIEEETKKLSSLLITIFVLIVGIFFAFLGWKEKKSETQITTLPDMDILKMQLINMYKNKISSLNTTLHTDLIVKKELQKNLIAMLKNFSKANKTQYISILNKYGRIYHNIEKDKY